MISLSLTPEQLILRRRGIGGSDINALSGLSTRWRMIDVWQSKVLHDAHREGEQPSVDAERGTFLEPGMRAWYAHRYNALIEEPGTLFHPEHEIVLATPDGVAHFNDGRPDRGVEIKCPRFRMTQDWCVGEWPNDIAVPEYYLPQVTWEAAVLGVEAVDMVVLLGDEMRVLPVAYDHEFFESLLYLAEKFWRDYVETGTPPPVDASSSYTEYLARRHPRHVTGAMLEPDEKALAWAKEFHRQSCIIKEAERARREARNHLENYIGDHAGLDCGENGKILWKSNKDSVVTDYKRLVADLNIPAETLTKYQTIRSGQRPFKEYLKNFNTDEAA